MSQQQATSASVESVAAPTTLQQSMEISQQQQAARSFATANGPANAKAMQVDPNMPATKRQKMYQTNGFVSNGGDVKSESQLEDDKPLSSLRKRQHRKLGSHVKFEQSRLLLFLNNNRNHSSQNNLPMQTN